jgi:hypothetical protein
MAQEILVYNHKLLTDSHPQYLFGTSPFPVPEEQEEVEVEVEVEQVLEEEAEVQVVAQV